MRPYLEAHKLWRGRDPIAIPQRVGCNRQLHLPAGIGSVPSPPAILIHRGCKVSGTTPYCRGVPRIGLNRNRVAARTLIKGNVAHSPPPPVCASAVVTVRADVAAS